MTTTTATADATFCYSIDAAGGRVFIGATIGSKMASMWVEQVATGEFAKKITQGFDAISVSDARRLFSMAKKHGTLGGFWDSSDALEVMADLCDAVSEQRQKDEDDCREWGEGRDRSYSFC